MQGHIWVPWGDSSRIASGLVYNLVVEINPFDQGHLYLAGCYEEAAVAEAGDDAPATWCRDFASMSAAMAWCEAVDLRAAADRAFSEADQADEHALDKQRMADWEASFG